MADIPKEALEALGLGPQDRVESLEGLRPVGSGTAHGFSSGAPLEQLAPQLLQAPWVCEELDLSGHPRVQRAGAVRRWPQDPGVFLVETQGGIASHGGRALAAAEDIVAVDARGGTAWLLLRGEEGDVVWEFSREQARPHLVERPGSAALDALAGWAPGPVAEVPPPDLDALTAGQRPVAWLREEAERLAHSPAALHRAAAAGLLARLWEPEVRARRGLADLLAEETVADRARAWLQSRTVTEQEALERLALAEVEALRGELGEVAAAVVEDPVTGRARLRDWVARRDRLQSVAFLHSEGALHTALDGLDEDAAAHHSAWSMVKAWDDDALLGAVSWQEPGVWWGRLAE